jgi:hypothetical protein
MAAGCLADELARVAVAPCSAKLVGPFFTLREPLYGKRKQPTRSKVGIGLAKNRSELSYIDEDVRAINQVKLRRPLPPATQNTVGNTQNQALSHTRDPARPCFGQGMDARVRREALVSYT